MENGRMHKLLSLSWLFCLLAAVACSRPAPRVTAELERAQSWSPAFVEHFGADRAMEGPVATASEDFGLFGARGGCPSVFWFVGGSDPVVWDEAFAAGRVNEDIAFNHSPRYAPVQDPTIRTGIEAMLVAAMCWLGS